MTEDQELAADVKRAADALAEAMNRAGNAGLAISLDMRPHCRDDYDGVTKTNGYIPILSVTRTIRL